MPVPHRDTLTLVTKLEGGSGHEVWTARHNSTQDLRVYKFCQADRGLNGLRREAALSQLLQQHLCERRDVARVLDWNFETAPYFVGFEFGGVDFATWARSDGMLASLSRRERLDVFLEIAHAVEAVHGVGVIHQDLKPSNILLSRRSNGGWHARLSDFECSKLEPSDRLANFRITQFGLLDADTLTTPSSSATPIYVAPELLTGQSASKQSDIYALGVLLYQILVGDLQRPMAQGWERHIDDELLRADISDATDCDFAQRFSSVAQLCTRLQELDQRRAASQQQQLAERASNLAREIDMRRCARRLWVLATAALVAIVIVQGTWLARIRSHAKQVPTATACTPELGLR
jgi:non-specific serine/threonine protein kinase